MTYQNLNVFENTKMLGYLEKKTFFTNQNFVYPTFKFDLTMIKRKRVCWTVLRMSINIEILILYYDHWKTSGNFQKSTISLMKCSWFGFYFNEVSGDQTWIINQTHISTRLYICFKRKYCMLCDIVRLYGIMRNKS